MPICLLIYRNKQKGVSIMSNYARWRNFTEEELKEIVASSKSNAEVARRLGYERAGGGTM
jgi:hypothetical protein